jgi:hypothetical protein
MKTDLRTGTLALALIGAAFFATPSLAVEPDVDSAAGPELPAPRDRPDFQTDDQTGASVLVPVVPRVEVAPEVVIPVPDEPVEPVSPPEPY